MIYVQVVLALLADGPVWHIVPDVTSFVGSVIVIIMVLVLQRQTLKEKVRSDVEMIQIEIE